MSLLSGFEEEQKVVRATLRLCARKRQALLLPANLRSFFEAWSDQVRQELLRMGHGLVFSEGCRLEGLQVRQYGSSGISADLSELGTPAEEYMLIVVTSFSSDPDPPSQATS